MPPEPRPRRMLDADQARRFYDDFGAKQDAQGWYEDEALDALVARSAFDTAHSVLELGCGTGRLAATLLSDHLPADCSYLGLDPSATMRELSAARLAPFGDRARVQPAQGSLPTRPGGWDRLLTTYVLDLLRLATVDHLLNEARHVLAPGGRLCVAGVTPGTGLRSRIVMGGWDLVHRLSPGLVGGCRPLRLQPRLDPQVWRILHHDVVTTWGVASEVLVAEPLRSPAPAAPRCSDV